VQILVSVLEDREEEEVVVERIGSSRHISSWLLTAWRCGWYAWPCSSVRVVEMGYMSPSSTPTASPTAQRESTQ
jgi:hypothetical protein